ncbi:MAG: insulinase family protein [candidate division NC10 bacterium]|nr:insulinase family protein [candidate division NC10 bacterium]
MKNEEWRLIRPRMRTGLVLLLLGIVLPRLVEAVPLGHRVERDNGLILLVAERPTLPMVTVEILVRTGSTEEPREKAGLANLTAVLLPEGTVSRTALEISEAIEFVGGGLGADASRNHSTLSVTVLKKDLDIGLELLADVLLHPAFREDEIARKIGELKGYIRQKQENPGTVAREAFAAALFGDHPYGRPVEGTEKSLNRITRKDLVNFHRRYYVPNNSIMAVAGEVTLKEFRGYVDKYFTGWARAAVPTVNPGNAAAPAGRQVLKINRGVTQANIVWGHLGIARRNPDYYALSVMNFILGGGGLTSRLMRAIREERGWAYDVHSFFSARLLPGPFVVGLQTKNETANPAIDEVLRQIRRIRETGVTPEELEEAKGFLTGSFPLRIDTNRDVVSFLTAIEYYGLGMDYPDRYPEFIRAVTRADVLRVARKYLHPDQGILVVVADLEKAKLAF